LELANSREILVSRGALFQIGKIVRRDSSKATRPIVKALTHLLEALVGHSHHDVRRSAVNCYVDLFQTFPGEVEQSAQNIDKVHQRLIELYRNR
jgi:hypothetical protein